MIVVKILERTGVIRLFGLALLLSPLFNTLASMSLRPNTPTKWSLQTFWKVASTGSAPDHILYFFSVVIGLVMLGGSAKAWRFVLLLLGGHILRQILQLGENIRTHWIYGLFFLINVSIFFFILDQLVWKQKSASTTKPSPKPNTKPNSTPVSKPERELKPQSTSRKVFIHFDGVGPWAQLTSVTNEGITVRSFSTPPADLQKKEIEIMTPSGLKLRTRLAGHKNHDFFFEYIHLTAQDIARLNQWLRQPAPPRWPLRKTQTT